MAAADRRSPKYLQHPQRAATYRSDSVRKKSEPQNQEKSEPQNIEYRISNVEVWNSIYF
jgi:hypothetical protein